MRKFSRNTLNFSHNSKQQEICSYNTAKLSLDNKIRENMCEICITFMCFKAHRREIKSIDNFRKCVYTLATAYCLIAILKTHIFTINRQHIQHQNREWQQKSAAFLGNVVFELSSHVLCNYPIIMKSVMIMRWCVWYIACRCSENELKGRRLRGKKTRISFFEWLKTQQE